MIFDLLKDLNQDCSFTDNIKESKFIQNGYENIAVSTNKKYRKLVECILCEFDPLYSTDIDSKFYILA